MFRLTIEDAARLIHNLNRDYSWVLGDYSAPPWDEAPDWQVESMVRGVEFKLRNPSCSPRQMHEEWLKTKREEGWAYGPVKEIDRKTHPCLCEYDELPLTQQVKDFLSTGVIDALRRAGVAPEVP